ncbi:hypothetical protein AAFF_G00090040 [Aldrovandia affinis]|uniref:Uncharacterized protein n=1 Tax=Aldrovandia affinis TaxID=143900 RepID=A0AAD7RVZ8_9TELE|nr:hypothetical protein AAFF_G00090040 [Aldrovandia affinis]
MACQLHKRRVCVFNGHRISKMPYRAEGQADDHQLTWTQEQCCRSKRWRNRALMRSPGTLFSRGIRDVKGPKSQTLRCRTLFRGKKHQQTSCPAQVFRWNKGMIPSKGAKESRTLNRLWELWEQLAVDQGLILRRRSVPLKIFNSSPWGPVPCSLNNSLWDLVSHSLSDRGQRSGSEGHQGPAPYKR